jgi:hypothetical protein
MADLDTTCYAYRPDTHEFVTQINADMDPLEDPPRVAWPANSTQIAPPEFSTGTVPVFDEAAQKWTVEPDFRGMYGYDPDGQLTLITQAGNPMTFDPPLSKSPPAVPDPEPKPVTDVSAAQALIQLSRIPYQDPELPGAENLADATEMLVQYSSDRELKIWFARAQRWYINNPNVKKLGARFNLDDDQIKAAFEAASQIEE